jgi:hypothetical protein
MLKKRMIVVTTGAFSLGCMVTQQEVHAHRPTVISPSAFLSSRIGIGQIDILVDKLPELANDVDFEKTFKACDGDPELAIDAYVSEVRAAYEKLDDDEADAKAKAFDAEQAAIAKLAAEAEAKLAAEEQAKLDAAAAQEKIDAEQAAAEKAADEKAAAEKAEADKAAAEKAEAEAKAKAEPKAKAK